MQHEFFSDTRTVTEMARGAFLLHGFLREEAEPAVQMINSVAAESPFRNMSTPGGFRMSVAMTNCGDYGWVTDRHGYRYSPLDPEAGRPWPPMPALFRELSCRAAERAGFIGFNPDACLINRYEPGARMTLHQDKDEADMDAPIVSVSLGLPATFQFGGLTRRERPVRYPLSSGDVVVWGGPARLNFHGVLALRDGEHPLTGRFRYNLTFRKAK